MIGLAALSARRQPKNQMRLWAETRVETPKVGGADDPGPALKPPFGKGQLCRADLGEERVDFRTQVVGLLTEGAGCGQDFAGRRAGFR